MLLRHEELSSKNKKLEGLFRNQCLWVTWEGRINEAFMSCLLDKCEKDKFICKSGQLKISNKRKLCIGKFVRRDCVESNSQRTNEQDRDNEQLNLQWANYPIIVL